MVTDDQICATLRIQWHLSPDEYRPLPTGGEARVWLVESGGRRYVAKLVPAGRREQLLAALSVAEHLHRLGFAVGAPVRGVDGQAAAPVPGGALVVLRHVPGRPLCGQDPVDQLWWGELLGAVHRALTGFDAGRLVRLGPLDPQAPHLSLQPWLRPAVAAATAALVRLTVTDQLTYGVVHGDPAAGSFRLDPDTGRVGLIGWDSVAIGLLMYDVANAVGYTGGPDAAGELLEGYASAGPLPAEEISSALGTVLRCRWARRADRYARRIAAARSAGQDDEAAWAGLYEARDALLADVPTREPEG